MAEEARLDPVAHVLLRARDWQDRPQLDEVCRWWARGGAGVCALVGIGGAGKTAVADRFLQLIPGVLPEHRDVPKREGLLTPARHFIFSFYDVPNAETFIADLGAWLGIGPKGASAAPVSYEQTLRKLTADGARAGDHGLLLVLDGLEKVQETGARGPFGRILDGRLRDLVLRAADGWLPGACLLVTSRFRLYDPAAQRSLYYSQIPVERLEAPTAVALLRARGVKKGTDGELRAVARDQGLHALTVDLMGGYIGRFCEGDPSKLPPEPHVPEPEAAEDPATAALREQERKFARVAERYREALAETDPAALALLQRVCLFRLGVAARTLADIFTGKGKEPISGRPLARLREAGIEGRLRLLAQMRLLEASGRQESPAESAIRNPQSSTRFIPPSATASWPASTRRPPAGATRRPERDWRARWGTDRAETPRTPPRSTCSKRSSITRSKPATRRTPLTSTGSGSGDTGTSSGVWAPTSAASGSAAPSPAAAPPRTAPLPEGLSKHCQAAFINEWALYLVDLGRLNAAARCFEHHNEMQMRQEAWENVSRGNQNLADVWLLAGRLRVALRAAGEALRLAERADDAGVGSNSHAYRAHARALLGRTDAALADFRHALHWQQKPEGETDEPLYSLRGIQQALFLAHLGRRGEATRLTEANREIQRTHWGEQDDKTPLCNLVLADLARQREDLAAARELLAQAHDWAVARGAKEVLCWAALVRGRIAGDAGQDHYDGGQAAIEEGLRITRDCGYGIHHIDLLLVRGRLHLLAGEPLAAEADARTALFGLAKAAEGESPYEAPALDEFAPARERGIFPPADSGRPDLLAAAHPECRYAWGTADARHLLAEALCLRAAQEVCSATYTPRSRNTPPIVRNLVKAARAELRKSARLRRRIKDPKIAETKRRMNELTKGILSRYPLTPVKPVPSRKVPDMPARAFDHKRLERLDELLEIEYDKLHDFQKELAITSSAPQKFEIKQRMKRELVPSLRSHEREYAELLAAGPDAETIPDSEAEVVVAELVEAVSSTEQQCGDEAPAEMLDLLREIKAKLDEPGKSAAAKLKVALPIVPLISSYELELDTENLMRNVWQKAKAFFKGLLPRRREQAD